MFNKLKQQFAPKKKKNALDEFVDKGFEIDFSNLWKYSSEELQNFIQLYEKQNEKTHKHYIEIIEENSLFKEKLSALETEKAQILTEKQQFKLQVDNICKILTLETKEKEKYKQELDSLRFSQKNELLNKENEMKLFEEFRNKLELLENLIKEKITEEIPPQFEKILQELEVYKASFSEILQNSKNSEIYIQNTKNNNELQEKYDLVLAKFEKTDQIKQELESDLSKMSEKLSIVKAESLTLVNSLNELRSKAKAEEMKINDLSLENRSLTEENELIKDKICSVITEKSKLEEVSSSGTRELKLKYEESKENIAKLEDFLKLQEEKNTEKVRDLENKLIQERLKFDQKLRDYLKLEEQYNQAKNDLLMQIENNNKAMEKIQLLDMKINNDKKMIKEEKHRHKALKKEILELQNKNWTENSGKDGKFKELEEKGEELKKKIELLEEERQGYLNKYLEMKSQEMKISELLIENATLKKDHEFLLETSQNIEKELNSHKKHIQTLQEKREASLFEIQKLSSEVHMLKSSQNVNTPKIRSQMKAFTEEIGSSQKEIRKDEVFSQILSPILSPLKIEENSQKSMVLKKNEAKYLGATKKELEVLYKELIDVMLPMMKDAEGNKAFSRIEKRLNDAIRRAHDHIDTLEDM